MKNEETFAKTLLQYEAGVDEYFYGYRFVE